MERKELSAVEERNHRVRQERAIIQEADFWTSVTPQNSDNREPQKMLHETFLEEKMVKAQDSFSIFVSFQTDIPEDIYIRRTSLP